MAANKSLIIQIYNVLKRHSSPERPLTQQQIIDYLFDEEGVECERKAVGRNVSRLKEFYNIESSAEGSYLVPDEPPLESYELRLLIDSVLCSKHIGPRYSADLIKKLAALGGEGLRVPVNVHSEGEWSKLDNKDFFFNIEVIDEAIESGKQMTFDYNTVGVDKKLAVTDRYVGTPYAMLLNNQRYYLIARIEKFGKVVYLRVDRITDPEILDAPAVPIEQNAGFERGLDFRELSTCLPYMFSDKPVRVTLRCGKGFVKDLTDWFGDGFSVTRQEGDYIVVRVRASEQAMLYWALQYNLNVEVLEPASLRDKIISTLKATLKMYAPDENAQG